MISGSILAELEQSMAANPRATQVALVVLATISDNASMQSPDQPPNSINRTKRDEQLWVSVKTSSAVEGIRKPFEQSSEQLAAKHAAFVKGWRIAADALRQQDTQT
jgi:hypothetical protein